MKPNRKPRVGPLDTVAAIRRELGRIYKAWRYSELDDGQLRAGTYCLKELRECLVATELEARIEALEAGTKPRINA
jgi:hypothetical protein